MEDFSDFYHSQKDRVFRVVMAAGGHRPVAEDAVAEAFARAFARWSRVRHHPNPPAWVMLAALNAQRSWWRETELRPSSGGRHMNDLESRIRRAYQDESFQLPETALPTVLARRRRRLSLAAAAAAVVAVIGGATLAFAVGTLPSPLPRVNDPATDPSARTRLCDRQGVELLQDQPGLRDRYRTMPERMVSFSEGGQWLNLYLGDRVIVSCLGPVDGEDAVVELDVLPMTDPEATWYSIGIMRPLGRSIVGGQSFLVVTVPPDTERVVAQLPDGTTVPAVPAIGTHVYVAWLPAHREDGLGAVEELTLTAYTPDIVYLYEDEVLTSRKR